MLTLLAIGSLWFWLMIIVSIVAITALIENEQNAWADVVFVATFVLLYKFGCGQSLTNLWSMVTTHIWQTILLVLGYFAAGTVYSILKWALYVKDGKQRILDSGAKFYADKWTPDYHKAKITHWMIYWPISGIWTIISNPVVKLFNRIFNSIKVVYQNISDRIMKDLIDKAKK